MKHTPARPLLVGLAAALALLALGGAPALAVELEAAQQDLEMLEKAAKKSKSTTEELRQYLRNVATAYTGIEGPTPPTDEEKAADPKAEDEYERAKAKFEKELEKFRKSARDVILKLVTLTKMDRTGATNIRDDVNIEAARVIGELAAHMDEKDRGRVARDLQKSIEEFGKAKHEVNTLVLDATFEALGKLNDHDSLEWLNKEFSHSLDNKKAFLVAAHKAMILFKNVEGQLKYQIVETFIKSYAGVELQAEQTSADPKLQAKKRFWDDVKVYTIPVVQYYAGQPTDDEGHALAEMKQFEDWWRDHKSPRKPPWTDPEPSEKEPAEEGEAPAEDEASDG